MFAALNKMPFRSVFRSSPRKPARAFMPKYCILARLKIVDRDFWIDGALLELDPNGALFRETSSLLLIRSNEEAILEVDFDEIRARISSTGPFGYRIEFFNPMALERVTDLRDRWRINA